MKAWIVFSLIGVAILWYSAPGEEKISKVASDEAAEEPEEIGFCGTVNDNDGSYKTTWVFKAKCATCHNMNKDGTGPRLQDVARRFPSEHYLKVFIRNQDSLMHVRDKFAIQVSQLKPTNFNHDFDEITEKQMSELIELFR